LDELLHQEFKDDKTYSEQIKGGNLFAGQYYGESDKMYISLNPGSTAGTPSFDVDLDDHDWYWGNVGQSWVNDHAYHKYANVFFHADKRLESWMREGAFTCSFLMPWRTPKSDSLKENPELRRRVWDYSGRIIRLMFEHCRPGFLIASGVTTLTWLQHPEYLDCLYAEEERLSLGRHHQCRKGWLRHGPYGDIRTFMVPHFSYSKSDPLLQECASWLSGKL